MNSDTIYFVYPNFKKYRSIQLGIAYLSSVLIDAGFVTSLIDTTWIDTSNIRNVEILVKTKLRTEKPLMVAISCRSLEFDLALKISKIIKNLTDSFIVFGGPHPTVVPEKVLSHDSIDAVCVGEGEGAILDLANKLKVNEDVHDIPNLWVKQQGKITKNSVRPLIENLDSIPFPDRSLFDDRHNFFVDYALKHPIRKIDIVLGRGCPNFCPYCIHHCIKRIYRGDQKYVRFRSIENIIAELKFIKEKFAPQMIFFRDDTIPLKKFDLKKFLKVYKEEISLPFVCLTSPEEINRSIAYALKQANCKQIGIGIETGDEIIRKKMLRRKSSNTTILKAFKYANDAGLWTHSFNLIGLPYESENNIIKTIAFNKKANPDSLQITYYYPFPGTDLRKFSKKMRLLDTKTENQAKLRSYHRDSILNFPPDLKKTIYMYKRALSNFYKIYFGLRSEAYPILTIILTEPIFLLRSVLDRCRIHLNNNITENVYQEKPPLISIIDSLIYHVFSLFLAILLLPYVFFSRFNARR